MKKEPTSSALIVVDLQNDFVDGSLAVPDAGAIVPVVNRLRDAFTTTVFTKDWHPANHGSFAANHPGKDVFEQTELAGLPQTLWPVHCVQGEHGSELAPGVNSDGALVVEKGTDSSIDSYSGFSDNGRRKKTELEEILKARHIADVYLCGLATDYCVKATALDAVALGFKTHLVEDACRGVNLRPGDVARALETMRAAGVEITSSGAILG